MTTLAASEHETFSKEARVILPIYCTIVVTRYKRYCDANSLCVWLVGCVLCGVQLFASSSSPSSAPATDNLAQYFVGAILDGAARVLLNMYTGGGGCCCCYCELPLQQQRWLCVVVVVVIVVGRIIVAAERKGGCKVVILRNQTQQGSRGGLEMTMR